MICTSTLLVLTLLAGAQDPTSGRNDSRRRRGAARPIEPTPARDFRLFVAGDTVITRPWATRTEPAFLALIEEVRDADAALVNLEMLLHSFEGIYPETYDGQGTPLAAHPSIARELQWAGIDIVAQAHDHSYDYGPLGILETQRHVEGFGLVVAGAGPDLQRARGPAFYYHRNGFVGVVAAAASYTRTGVATPARAALHGKPGVNPLNVRIRSAYTITATAAAKLVKIAAEEGIDGVAVEAARGGERVRFLGRDYVIGDRNHITHSGTVSGTELEANLTAVRKADADADIAVFSIHASQPGDWLRDVAHQAVDAGADVVVIHGSPQIRGIEIYQGRPIFHGLGNFVFQEETVARLPAAYLEHLGLPTDTPAETVMRAASSAWREPTYWEGLAATVRFVDGAVNEIRLLPLTLGNGRPFGARGTPSLADAELGEDLIARATNRSLHYGTEIRYDFERNLGLVTIR